VILKVLYYDLKKLNSELSPTSNERTPKNEDDICRQKSIVDISTQRHVEMSTTEVIVE
jgi:hypothetical protein